MLSDVEEATYKFRDLILQHTAVLISQYFFSLILAYRKFRNITHHQASITDPEHANLQPDKIGGLLI